MSEESGTILLADDDPDIRMFLEVTLGIAGFTVHTAADGVEVVELAREVRPDIVLLDVMMPRMDGLEATRRLRADPVTGDVPIILVTAKAMGDDKVTGLQEGADDYVTKPFDPDELVARIRAALRRASAIRQVSPLSGLPGNTRIEAELERRVSADAPFALLYCDLNKFKAYNDHYGFMQGDRLLRAYADLLTTTAEEMAPGEAFVGHVGGDDFVIMTGMDAYERLAAELCRRFDELAPTFYEPDDRSRGHIEIENRRGVIEQFGFVSLDIGIAHTGTGPFEHPGQVVAIATEMKHVAKMRSDGDSVYAVDRRSRP